MRLAKAIAILFILYAALLAPAGGFAAEAGAMGGTTAWPASAGGWVRAGGDETYIARAIYDYMDGAGEVFLAYNFKRLAVQRYVRQDHPGITAELYEMGTPEDAFGVFAWDRQDPDAGIGQGSEFGGGMLRFWKGRHFVSIYGEGEGKEQEQALLALGRDLAAAIRDTGAPPRLLGALPDERQVQGSVRFVRSHVLLNQRCFIADKNILGLKADTEAVFARYDLGKERTFVVIVGYPTAKRAQAALAAFRKAYKAGSDGMAEAEGAWTATEAQGRRIVIALRAPTRDSARRLVDAAKTRINDPAASSRVSRVTSESESLSGEAPRTLFAEGVLNPNNCRRSEAEREMIPCRQAGRESTS